MALAKFSEGVAAWFMDQVCGDATKENPFVQENNTTYMRYDSIQIQPIEPGTVRVTMWWKGKPLYYIDTEFIDELWLNGVNGKMEIDLE